jgi:hypothetical protein
VISGERSAIEALPGTCILGTTGGTQLTINGDDGAQLSVSVADLSAARDGGLRRWLA